MNCVRNCQPSDEKSGTWLTFLVRNRVQIPMKFLHRHWIRPTSLRRKLNSNLFGAIQFPLTRTARAAKLMRVKHIPTDDAGNEVLIDCANLLPWFRKISLINTNECGAWRSWLTHKYCFIAVALSPYFSLFGLKSWLNVSGLIALKCDFVFNIFKLRLGVRII